MHIQGSEKTVRNSSACLELKDTEESEFLFMTRKFCLGICSLELSTEENLRNKREKTTFFGNLLNFVTTKGVAYSVLFVERAL